MHIINPYRFVPTGGVALPAMFRYYKMDDTTGTDAVDSGTDGLDAAIVGSTPSVMTVSGEVGTALLGDGGNDQASAAVLSVINDGMTSDFAMSMLVYIESALTGQDTILGSTGNFAGGDQGIQVEWNSAGYFLCKAEKNSSTMGRRFDGSVGTTGIWQHLGLNYDTATNTITTYVDGVATANSTATGSVAIGASSCLSLWARCNEARESNVRLDEVGFWAQKLTADQHLETETRRQAGIALDAA